ncbi:ABC transporter ATP-binding protein [Ketobacter sp. MCCC 1A13808]|uniref:ABC transporter ATP-binding protein n=1 Tax=Ketobacter sp. MCCC 1A13808 TaxID=2602738 RepID=UPI0012EBA389|nr:ABC transporter ATP-binding protein [Ketobacter sp. MCCC 1A13808]MVF12914.1 ABC transporter ATP-binding protein [Ketobacter sp. MCCC 1A13808]
MTTPTSTDSGSVLQAREVSKSVPMPGQPLQILNAINLSVNKAESLAIVGESGSGKSTLLGLLAGLDVPSSGSIALMGNNLETMNEDQRAKVRAAHVGFVFQSFQLLANLSALENVMLPLEIGNVPNADTKAQDILYRVGLEKRIHHYPSQLSGGEQQRVALARAFVAKPDILFADEPTGNLDTKTGASIADQLFELNATEDTTLILVTHDIKLALRCNRTITMNAGQLQSDLSNS